MTIHVLHPEVSYINYFCRVVVLGIYEEVMLSEVPLKKKRKSGPGQRVQLAGVPHRKVADSIPGQGTYKNQPMDA